MPRNLLSQRNYHGINVWLLGCQGYSSPFWCTFQQALEAGGHVRRGEHGTPIIFAKPYVKTRLNDAGEEVTETRRALKTFIVLNAAQLEGIAVPVLEQPTQPFPPIAVCEKLVGNMPHRPAIMHGSMQAFYRPSQDAVHMPSPELFPVHEEYYSTLFHELTHSTGHPDRLNRPTLKDAGRFGDANYSREELVAEMGASFLCGVCGIENRTIDNSAAYLAGWMKALRHDPQALIVAAGQAERAADYIRGVSREQA